ncbi:SdiA-regulated domain-containing protein [Runella sp.]|uniref:SdiA-regulated domain-containing protein n=1 Tax=Runella sp. TaxID=1960881 RepID=UPI003D0D0B0F
MAIVTRVLASLFLLSGILSCDPSAKDEKGDGTTSKAVFVYDLTQPAETYILPKELKEISGVAYFGENQLICVQDEKGEVFVYDVSQQKITQQHRFGPDDDYEGIEKIDDEIYVLRSDGTLFNFKLGNKETREIATTLPGKNDVEGLTYDFATKRLWLAVKEASKKAAKDNDKVIFSFDLKSRRVFTERELKEKQFQQVGFKGKDWQDFKPSDIASHPQTGELFLLSSAGHRLVIFSPQGVAIKNIALDPKQFRQPEGICFTPDGTLYISSEGDGKEGYILKFNPLSEKTL